MYDRVLNITINSYYSKVPSTGTAVLKKYSHYSINSYYSKVPSTGTRHFFSTVLVLRYNFNKIPNTGTAVLLRSTVPTVILMHRHAFAFSFSAHIFVICCCSKLLGCFFLLFGECKHKPCCNILLFCLF